MARNELHFTAADERQEGGQHYRKSKIQHWHLVDYYGWDYFTAQVIKYMMRWKAKNGVEDLRKANHFLQKLIELQEATYPEPTAHDPAEPGPGYVNQDRP